MRNQITYTRIKTEVLNYLLPKSKWTLINLTDKLWRANPAISDDPEIRQWFMIDYLIKAALCELEIKGIVNRKETQRDTLYKISKDYKVTIKS